MTDGAAVEAKRCRKCSTVKPASEFYRFHDTKDGLQSYCKLCSKSIALAWMKANKPKDTRKNRVRKPPRPEQLLEYRRRDALRAKEVAANLGDKYVRLALSVNTGIKRADVPREMIEAKRKALLIHRLLKERMK